jgi:hypothetical protein
MLHQAGLSPTVVSFEDGRPDQVRTPDDMAAQAIIDAYTLADAAAYLSAQITAHAKDLRDKAVEGISPGEMASWPIKRAEALAYQASGNAADAPMLSAEAEARKITLAALVGKIAGNVAGLSGLEAIIAGTAGRHADAIRACTSFDDMAAYDWQKGWPAV